MENQFVPYDMAVKLKDIGFDDFCLVGYETKWNGSHELIMPRNKFGWLIVYKKSSPSNAHVVKAPMWQQVFDWFRNKKVLIEVSAIDSWDYWSATIYMEDCMSPFFVAFQDNEYEAKTYEEAREYAILKAIDLITK